MKTFRLLCRIVIPAVMSGIPFAFAQTGNGLLLPFPAEAAAETASASSAMTVPGRAEVTVDDRKLEEARHALELADTFIRRQQMEVANSVPRRGMSPVRVPARTAVSRPAIALHAVVPSVVETAGPVSELLPLPGENAGGDFINTGFPEADAMLPPGESPSDITLPDETSAHEVPRSELASAPAYGGVEVQDRRGPVFRVNGAEAFKVARSRGYKFTPAGGIGARDGIHTAASQFPNVLTSEVHGPRMSQLRPPATWSLAELSNTFFMFCDPGYNAVRLAPGWRIRGINLEGPAWRWVACPRSGAGTASFSIRVHSYKGQEAATAVTLAGLTLEGPEGATDWKEAFPWINGKGPVNAPQAAPGAPAALESARLAAAAEPAGEPPLPQ